MADAFTVALPPHRTTPKVARVAVARRFGSEARCGDLLLCISEVVTNSVRHAQTAVEMKVTRRADLLRVEVSDAYRGVPVMRPRSRGNPTGRGLQILDRLALRWGTRPTPDGKVVWFDFDLKATA